LAHARQITPGCRRSMSRAKSYPFVKKRCVVSGVSVQDDRREMQPPGVFGRGIVGAKVTCDPIATAQRADVPQFVPQVLPWSWFSHYRQHYSLRASGSATQMSSPPAGSALHASAELTADTGPQDQTDPQPVPTDRASPQNSLTTGWRDARLAVWGRPTCMPAFVGSDRISPDCVRSFPPHTARQSRSRYVAIVRDAHINFLCVGVASQYAEENS